MDDRQQNTGLDLQRETLEQNGTEYLAGSLPPCKAAGLDALPFEQMKTYFPKGELQRSDRDDMQDCVARAFLNILECKYNYLLRHNLLTPSQIQFVTDNQYLTESGFEFSDAFIAIKAGTTKRGTSLKSGAQAIHEHGLIPKKMLPLESWMTFDDYHNPNRITDKMELLGERWQEVMGEIFYGQEYDYNRKIGIATGVHAWPFPDDNGIYQRVERGFNHAVWRSAPKHYVFDNYIDTHDNDFIKKLAPDYQFLEYGYTIVVGEPKKPQQRPAWPIDLLKRLWLFFTSFVKLT